jgi:hypothetical protein
MLKLSLILSIALMSQNAAAATIALIGDSISTGGASHSALAFDIDRMEAVISGRTPVGVDQATVDFLSAEGIPAPYTGVERLGLSPREFTHPLVWMFNNFVTSMSTQFLDTEEFSWGYLLGRMRGDNTIIAARDGEKSFQARLQIDRLLDGAPDTALDHVFVFFTGNDICAPHPSLVTTKNDYLANINDAVRYLIRNAKPKAGGGLTHVWLLDPLGVSQIATSPAILNKKVTAYGKEVSCKDLQSDQIEKDLVGNPTPNEASGRLGLRAILAQVFQGGPYGLCPSLFNYHSTGSLEDLLPISNALQGYREGLTELSKNLNDVSPLYRVQQINAPASIMFEADDIGNDCFHLSVKGQLKVAKAVKAEMQTKYQQ